MACSGNGLWVRGTGVSPRDCPPAYYYLRGFCIVPIAQKPKARRSMLMQSVRKNGVQLPCLYPRVYSLGLEKAAWAGAWFQKDVHGRNGRGVRAGAQCPWPGTRGPKGTWQQRGRAVGPNQPHGVKRRISCNSSKLGEGPRDPIFSPLASRVFKP